MDVFAVFRPQPEALPAAVQGALARQLRAHEPRNGYDRFGRWFLGDTLPEAPSP